MTPRVIKMDVNPYLFDVRVRLILNLWTFWANLSDVNTSVWTSSETLLRLLSLINDTLFHTHYDINKTNHSPCELQCDPGIAIIVLKFFLMLILISFLLIFPAPIMLVFISFYVIIFVFILFSFFLLIIFSQKNYELHRCNCYC